MATLPIREYPAEDFFTTAVQIDSAVKTGLKAWGLFVGSSITYAKRNLADATNFFVTGTPTVGAKYATFKGATNFLRTSFTEPEEFTICFYTRLSDTIADSAHTQTICGSFLGGAGLGLLVYWSNATTLRAQVYQSGGTVKLVTLTVSDPTYWKRYTITMEMTSGTAGTLTLKNETDGTSSSVAITAAREMNALPICIGSSQSATYEGDCDLYHFAMWNEFKSSADILAHWEDVEVNSTIDGIVENSGTPA